MPIRFEKRIVATEFYSPLCNFDKTTHILEYRKDPLTGFVSRINMERSKRTKYTVETTELEHFIDGSRKKCFFCPESLEASTPMFEFGGRIVVGEAVAFPNLFPFGENHAVVTLTKDHFVLPSEFKARTIADGCFASLQFFREVLKRHPDCVYLNINWNFMPPAAASIVHPHFQILAESKPTLYQQVMIEKSREYATENGSNYWLELVEEEKKLGERFIYDGEHLACVASFAPQANNDILIVFKRISSFLEATGEEIMEFSEIVAKVVNVYGKIGIDSFNMATFSGPPAAEYYRLNVKLVSRPNLRHIYISDAGFMERLHYEPVVETLPEMVAKRFREFLS